MIQLAYTSIAAKPLKQTALLSLLQQSRLFNAQHKITGILLYKDKSFFQVIEGDIETVDKLLLKISGDSRHDSINVMYRRQIEKRDFERWSMGFVNIEEEQYDLEAWESNSFRFPLQDLHGNFAQLLNVTTAKTLVRQFSPPCE